MADIILRNENGEAVKHEGIKAVSFTTPDGGMAVYSEGGGAASEQEIREVVKNYLEENTDETLNVNNGVLSVNCATEVEDNTLPITAAAVHTTVGNIETLLATI